MNTTIVGIISVFLIIFATLFLIAIFGYIVITVKSTIWPILKRSDEDAAKYNAWINTLPEYSIVQRIRNFFLSFWEIWLIFQICAIPLHLLYILFTRRIILHPEHTFFEFIIFLPITIYTYNKLLKSYKEKGFFKTNILYSVISILFYYYSYINIKDVISEKIQSESALYILIALCIIHIFSIISFYSANDEINNRD